MLFSCCVLLQRHKVMRLSVSMGTTARPQHRDMLPRPWPGTAPPILARAPCSPTMHSTVHGVPGTSSPETTGPTCSGHPWAHPPGGPLHPSDTTFQSAWSAGGSPLDHPLRNRKSDRRLHRHMLTLAAIRLGVAVPTAVSEAHMPPFHVGRLAWETRSALVTMGVGLHRHPGSA